AEGGGDLERAADAEAPDRARQQADDAAPREAHVTAVGRKLAVDHIEAGRLAGAIGPDERQELASSHREADLPHRMDAAERLRQRRDLEHAHAVPPRSLTRLATAPTMPLGKARTRMRMMPPRSARQYSVWRMIVSCSHAKTLAPTIGPLSVWMPPSSTMTRPSIERPTDIVSGEIEPLAKAKMPPAMPQTVPAIAKASQCTRFTSMPIASARRAESRPARMA